MSAEEIKVHNYAQNKKILVFVNVLIVISVSILATRGFFFGAGGGQVGPNIVRTGYFKPYTIDSNIFGGVAALLLIIKRKAIPKWVAQVYLMATCCLALTLILTAGFLAPMRALGGGNYFSMFFGDMFFSHLVNPMLTVLTFTCLMKEHIFSRKDCILAMTPTIIYSIVYFIMVVILKRWNDFYGFTFGGRYAILSIVVAVIYAGVFFIAKGLTHLHNK